MSAKTENEQRQTLRRIISTAHTAFLVTNSPKGPHGRPMATAEVTESMETFYFPTERNSAKVGELAADDHVFLGYVSGSEWATVTGRGKILDDKAKNKELWSSLWKNWFSGPEDPNMVLIAVTPEMAEYWDSASRAIVLAKMAYTAVTGQKTQVSEHAKLAL
ncbi:MAG: pyridoxamine 5-phosphate oxidase-related FMN-binding protein [Phycisphaerales bacterium]|nr:pyridoxamine 5-phosphate oxidase-related FMN-binding protein [Phycisphaerales bacterium]